VYVGFYDGVFGVGRSNGATFECQKAKMAADGHLGHTKMVITSQLVCHLMWFLVLEWGLSVARKDRLKH